MGTLLLLDGVGVVQQLITLSLNVVVDSRHRSCMYADVRSLLMPFNVVVDRHRSCMYADVRSLLMPF